MQQVWDLIGPLIERYLRLRPIWQIAVGAFIEGFEASALKRLLPKEPLTEEEAADYLQIRPQPRKASVGQPRPCAARTTPERLQTRLNELMAHYVWRQSRGIADDRPKRGT